MSDSASRGKLPAGECPTAQGEVGGLRTERRALDELRLDEANARLHPEANLAAIQASLQRFGLQKPLVIDPTGRVIAGNGTLLAARALGWTHVDVVVTGLVGAEARAYGLADNRSGELAQWDDPELAKALAALADQDIDLVAAAGFDPAALDGFAPAPSEVDAEPRVGEAAALRAKWNVELGQVWQLGAHRLACGDSTDVAAVAAVLRGDRPEIMVTDPPYGVEYDAAWRNEAGIAATKQTGRVHNDDRASWAAAFRHFPGDVAYVWHAGRFATAVERSLVVLGFEIRAQIVWVKRRFAISRGHYHWRHEPCWYAVRRGGTAHWAGSRKQSTAWADIVDAFPQPDLFACQLDDETVLAFDGSATTVWEIPGDRAAGGGHSTQKPVEAMARPIRNHDVSMVYEPFSGSGTTIIACERLGKACRALELSPEYVAVALQRWADATGDKPEVLRR